MKVVQLGNCVVLCDNCAGFCPTDSISIPDKAEIKKLVGQLQRNQNKAAGS